MRELLKAAALRKVEITLFGEILVCHEPPATAFTDLHLRRKTDPVGAYAGLFERFVTKQDGTPAFTKEEAFAIASGSAKVFTPLILALTNTLDDEKKVLVTLIDSDIGSPSDSDEASKS